MTTLKQSEIKQSQQ